MMGTIDSRDLETQLEFVINLRQHINLINHLNRIITFDISDIQNFENLDLETKKKTF